MESEDDSDCESYPPWNFAWIVRGELALMAWPQTKANIRYIRDQGISHLVTLSPEKKPSVAWCTELKWSLIPVKEFESPTINQIEQFIEICNKNSFVNKAVGVHCRMGRGRSGVMAACYLVHFHTQTPARAILHVRSLVPGAIETPEQENVITEYHDILRGPK